MQREMNRCRKIDGRAVANRLLRSVLSHAFRNKITCFRLEVRSLRWFAVKPISTREDSMTETGTGQGGRGALSSSYAAAKEDRTAGNAGADRASSADELRETLSEDMQTLKDLAQHQISSVSDKARDGATDQKNFLATQLAGVAAALEKVGGELETGDQADIGRMTKGIGASIQRFANDIHDRKMGEVAGMAEDFGRKQPFAFLGMAAIAGLAASRFLTASARRSDGAAERTSSFAASGETGGGNPSNRPTPAGQKSEGNFNG
jgi:ElaB/YqjD/DUF883 family membrane-anchored ribosome-binding protein